MEKLTTLSISSIPLGESPTEEGESKMFKQNIVGQLDEFKSKHKILFPLVHPIGITVFYTPPKRNARDLDNLARTIIPILIEKFNPPSTPEIPNRITDKFAELTNFGRSKQRIPKNIITNYQIIHRPRKEDSREKGEIDLFIMDGNDFYYNLWNQIDYVTSFIE